METLALAMRQLKVFFDEVCIGQAISFSIVVPNLCVGARVILACRNMNKGHRAIQQLCAETRCEEKNIRLMECDLCSFESIRHFAELYNREEERLDVLICNAGLAWSSNLFTKDGFNSVIQANYLGHFLLTNLLLDKLKKCRPSRIINVSSMSHKRSYQCNFDMF